MIKLIVSDIDGTLVEDGGNQINPELLEVIVRLKEKGVHFVAASGRQAASIEYLFAPIKEKLFYVGNNGAYVGCYGRTLFLFPMDRQLALAIAADIKKDPQLEVMLEGPRTAYLDTRDEEFVNWMKHGYHFQMEQVDDILKVEGEIIKISAYKKQGIQKATSYLANRYQQQMKITISGDMWMDCMDQKVNKGHAIGLLQESLHISPMETMAFGDQLNDIEMLQSAYYSFAIGNARPEVKAVARFMADSNHRDGVLKVLKTLL